MGDADGDRAIIEGREWLLSWMSPRNKVGNVHGGNEVVYELEPAKADAEKDKTAKIKMLNFRDGKPLGINRQAIELVSRDGGGPVGQLTYMHAMFMGLAVSVNVDEYKEHFLRCALVMSILVQEAIDRMKRTTPYTNPDFAFKKDSWKEVSENVYALPKDNPARFAGAHWYNDEEDLDMKKVREWSYEMVEFIYPELKGLKVDGRRTWGVKDLMGWRKITDGDKKLDPRTWAHVDPLVGQGNLVNFCSGASHTAWLENYGISISRLANPEIISLLQEALGDDEVSWKPMTSIFDGPQGANDLLKRSKMLKAKVGLKGYNEAMYRIRNMDYETRADARRTAQAEMSTAVSLCTIQEIVTAMVMEMEGADEGSKDRVMNNVFRLASCPGNPLMEKLGFEEGGVCSYMATEVARIEKKKGKAPVPVTRAQMAVKYLEKKMKERQETGEAVTLFQMALEATGRIRMNPKLEDEYARKGVFFDQSRNFNHLELGLDPEEMVSRHFKQTGVKVHKCRHCCDLLDFEVRKFMTDDKKMENRQMVTRRLTVMKNWDTLNSLRYQQLDFRAACKANQIFLSEKQINSLLKFWKHPQAK